jgi:hypothetical protein
MRAVGKSVNAKSFGYSAHVQLATLSRIGTFIGLPIIAFLIDSGINSYLIFVLPVLTFFLYIIFSLISLFSKKVSISIAIFCFKKIVYFSKVELKLEFSKTEFNQSFSDISHYPQMETIKKYGFFAFIFTSGAFFISSILAKKIHLYRATILQLTPFVSFVGTINSVLYFDPMLSHLIDCSDNPFPIVFEVFKIRLKSALVLLLLFLLIFISVFYYENYLSTSVL